ncbi:MAG: chemotaxis protein [Actinobacillus minor]|nr:chemotaxis protein [Actinobacillus minor]
MPLPFILAGVAVAAAGIGAKKAYDGYQDSSEADDIVENAKSLLNEEESFCKKQQEITNNAINKLKELEVSISADFSEFEQVSKDLLKQLEQNQGAKDLQVNIPTRNKDRGISAESLQLLTKSLVGSGVAANIGMGIALMFSMTDTLKKGLTYASYASQKLEDAKEYRNQVQKAVDKMVLSRRHLKETEDYVNKVYKEVNRVYQVFKQYSQDLKAMDSLIRNKVDVYAISSAFIPIIENGYAIAAILTNIINTPLFKVKKRLTGEVVKNSEGMIEFEKDNDGMQIINKEEIDQQIQKSQKDTISYQRSK